MIIILFVFMFLVMIGVGGYFIYREIQKEQKTEELASKADEIAKTPGLHLFSECDYEGQSVNVTENLPESTEDETVTSVDTGFYSFVLTDGYKIDTYTKPDLQGGNISYTGPQNIRCSNRIIKSVRLYKV